MTSTNGYRFASLASPEQFAQLLNAVAGLVDEEPLATFDDDEVLASIEHLRLLLALKRAENEQQR